MHLPALCLSEVPRPIRARCQPRNEAGAIRDFLKWSRNAARLTAEDYQTTDRLLSQFEAFVDSQLAVLPGTLAGLRNEPNLEVFALNERMLAMSIDVAVADLPLQPFDQSILAAILIRARELWGSGEHDLCFCEMDADLWPQDRNGNARPPLEKLYREASVWVYKDFEMSKPVRPAGWPPLPPSQEFL